MFGVVPKTLWQKTNPADELNRVKLSTRNLLLISDDKIILIDTGIGEYWDDKFTKIYGVDHSMHSLTAGFKKNGIEAGDITDVILTHLHFDHTGGSVTRENNKFLPAFPKATYHVQKKHFDWANNPSEKDRASFIRERFIPLFEEGVLNLIDNKNEFDENISFMLIDGHTIAQQMVKISDGSETLLYCADLMPFASHIRIPYIMAYDINPLKTLEEKKTILPQAAEKEWKLFFEHDPEITAATVERSQNGFVIKNALYEL